MVASSLRTLAVLLALAACKEVPTVVENPVASVNVTPLTDTLVLAREVQLLATVRSPTGGSLSGVSIIWSTLTPAIARVSASGLVTTLGLGVATIVAEAFGKQGTAVLTIVPKIVLAPRLPSAFTGDTIQLTARVTDANNVTVDAGPLRWESGDPSVAGVSNAGVVSCTAVGQATISVSAAGGRDSVIVIALVPSIRPNREIAFFAEGTLAFGSEVHTINPDGSGETRVSRDGEFVREFTWSPLGDRLAVMYVQRNGVGLTGLYVMNADGSNLLRIADAGFDRPRWSPDGGTIAFGNYTSFGESDIKVVAATGGELRQLTRQPGDEMAPQWSPDGRRIAYHHSTGGAWELWVMDRDGNSQTRLSSPTTVLNPRWSPDGKQIAFDNGAGIWLVNADGSGLHPFTSNCAPSGACSGTAQYTDPTWSADAKRLAYSAYDQVAGISSVVVSTLGGIQLAHVPAAACCFTASTRPDWSPDNSKVAYEGSQLTPPPWPGVFLVNADGSGPQFITGAQNAGPGRWRP